MNSPNIDQNAPESLAEIEKRVLWLSTAMIHHANRVRPNPSGLKVGGHQASCASMVSIMTSLWFGQLRSGDRVSVKPHAAPVLHGINYLLGELDESYLTTLREFGACRATRVDRKILIRWIIRPVRWASARRLPSGAPSLADTSTPPRRRRNRASVLPGR